jgi:hypothetical protein
VPPARDGPRCGPPPVGISAAAPVDFVTPPGKRGIGSAALSAKS